MPKKGVPQYSVRTFPDHGASKEAGHVPGLTFLCARFTC
ncbi:MAG: hypothetical protein JWM57_1174 [Phycisphaerales bacterium]|nr:hypothetical protein [Phycisphaerales bacterium]